jgi:hypothetical protein
MKNKAILIVFLFFSCLTVFSQNNSFSYIGKFSNESELKAISDSLQLPLLVVNDEVYSIGSDCISRALDGNISDRDTDGANNNRNRLGANTERNKSGSTAERSKKGKKNNRKKDGENNDRNDDGTYNDRDIDGNSNNRNKSGAISEGVRCAIDKKGKLILYTRKKINTKTAKIYYHNSYFTNKHFKIIQL